jgi:hypothetical protein
VRLAQGKGKQKAKHAGGNQYLKDKEVFRCSSMLPSANYLPLNLLKHMGLGVTFAQETFIDIICSLALTFFPHGGLNKCLLHSGIFPPSLPGCLFPPSLPLHVGESDAAGVLCYSS